MLLQKLACKGVARFSAYEILDLHTGLTVLPVGSNGAHIKGVASSLQLPTSSTPTGLSSIKADFNGINCGQMNRRAEQQSKHGYLGCDEESHSLGTIFRH